MKRTISVLLPAALAAGLASAAAQDYPDRAITFVVPSSLIFQ